MCYPIVKEQDFLARRKELQTNPDYRAGKAFCQTLLEKKSAAIKRRWLCLRCGAHPPRGTRATGIGDRIGKFERREAIYRRRFESAYRCCTYACNISYLHIYVQRRRKAFRCSSLHRMARRVPRCLRGAPRRIRSRPSKRIIIQAARAATAGPAPSAK